MKKVIIIMTLIVASFISADAFSADQKAFYYNPILAGFYPDPSICRVGDDYYLVNSTFAYFPGIPVFHSRDLVNWKLIGHVMDRVEQMNLEGLGVSEGIFAPAIRFHDGLFYITCTLVGAGGNYVVTAQNPAGPWSNPVWLPQIDGIDPSLFFDQDGKAYIVYNSVAPNNRPLYEGHRTIRMYQFDYEKLKVISPEIILVNGGTDISKKPIWIEGPHIFRKDNFYYLICAEGGTSWEHSEVVFRSEQVTGPYVPYAKNPILTQRHLDPNRPHPITCTGHADLVMTPAGDWWAVFLGCRPYLPEYEGYFNTGRETFMAPVKWIDGWPVIDPDHAEIQYSYPLPIILEKPIKADIPYSGNFRIRDDFDSETLDLYWVFLRTPHTKWYSLSDRRGSLAIQLRPETCSGKSNPSFIGRRQQHLCGSVSTAMDFVPVAEFEKAGLLVFQNEKHYYFLGKSIEKGEPVVQLYKTDTLLASHKIGEGRNIRLKVVADGAEYSFYYATKQEEWILLKDKVDARFLSTRVAGGFVGCMYAMYATSSGEASSNVAYFDWFEYVGDDEIYHQ
ncbi:MAG TPA: glycoside hydrolase family 43 protein [Candidatus Marinimicrobia bacterium]|nr:glycoside hydrolase family 43 protein [Candidatus Neomarinimicrobiota bacterium]